MPASMASISEKSETTQGKSVPSRIAGAAQEERRGRKVVDRLHADLRFDGLEAGDPDAGLFFALLGFLALVAGELHVLAVRLAAVAVVRLVVDDDDVLLVAQLAADAADHLVGRLRERRSISPLRQNRFGELAGGHLLAQQEGVEVGDQDLGLARAAPAVRPGRCRVGGSSSADRWAGARAGGRGW